MRRVYRRVALRIARQPDLAHPAIREQPFSQQRCTVGIGPERLRCVARYEEHLSHARQFHRAFEEGGRLLARGNTARGQMRHRLEPRIGHAHESLERFVKGMARQVTDVNRRASGEQSGNDLCVLGAMGDHLDRARSYEFGNATGGGIGGRPRFLKLCWQCFSYCAAYFARPPP